MKHFFIPLAVGVIVLTLSEFFPGATWFFVGGAISASYDLGRMMQRRESD